MSNETEITKCMRSPRDIRIGIERLSWENNPDKRLAVFGNILATLEKHIQMATGKTYALAALEGIFPIIREAFRSKSASDAKKLQDYLKEIDNRSSRIDYDQLNRPINRQS